MLLGFTNEHCKYEYKDNIFRFMKIGQKYYVLNQLEKVLKLSNIYIKASIIIQKIPVLWTIFYMTTNN
jgi:hypothetical protein